MDALASKRTEPRPLSLVFMVWPWMFRPQSHARYHGWAMQAVGNGYMKNGRSHGWGMDAALDFRERTWARRQQDALTSEVCHGKAEFR